MHPMIGLAYLHRTFLPRLSAQVASDVVTGYGDHQVQLRQIGGGLAADNAFRIGTLAHEFVTRLRSGEQIVEIMVIGHADFAYRKGRRNLADEDHVSQQRAEDVWKALLRAILTDPSGNFTPKDLFDAIDSGRLRIIVTAVGARQPLVKSSGASPENRRVEIKMFSKQSTDI